MNLAYPLELQKLKNPYLRLRPENKRFFDIGLARIAFIVQNFEHILASLERE